MHGFYYGFGQLGIHNYKMTAPPFKSSSLRFKTYIIDILIDINVITWGNEKSYIKLSGGSRISRWGGGGVDRQCRRFSAKMYVKTKELGPVGGHAPGTPPRSTNETGGELKIWVTVYGRSQRGAQGLVWYLKLSPVRNSLGHIFIGDFL